MTNFDNFNNFDINDDTNFWIYVTTIKLWEKFKNSNMIATSKDSTVEKDDIIIIYIRGSGFICIAQIGSEKIDNSDGKIKIFADKNLNQYCYQIQNYVFLKTIKMRDVISKINEMNIYKFNKYVRGDSVFNSISYSLGYDIVKIILIDLAEFIDNEPKSDDDQKKIPKKNISKKKIINKRKISNNNKKISNKNNIDNNNIPDKNNVSSEQNNKGNVPIMIVLCQRGLDELLREPDNESKVIFDHMFNCDECDITDNGEIRTKLFINWYKSTIEYSEVDSKDEKFNEALDAYHNLRKYTSSNDTTNSKIKLLNIIEQDHLYNNCMLIESYFVPDIVIDQKFDISNNKSDNISDKKSDNISDKKSDKKSDNISDKKSDNISDKKSDNISNKKSKILVRGKNNKKN